MVTVKPPADFIILQLEIIVYLSSYDLLLHVQFLVYTIQYHTFGTSKFNYCPFQKNKNKQKKHGCDWCIIVDVKA